MPVRRGRTGRLLAYPSRGGSYWGPEYLGSLALHLDASDLTTGDVTTWADRTSNDYDFTAYTDRPPEKKATVLNGEPGVEFRWKTDIGTYDGEGMKCTIAGLCALFATAANPWTVHIVGSLDSFSADGNANAYYSPVVAGDSSFTTYAPWCFYGATGSGAGDLLSVWSSTADPGGPGVWTASGTNFPDALLTGPHLLTLSWTGSVFAVYVDGTLYAATSNTYANDDDNFTCASVEFGDDWVKYGSPEYTDTPMATYGAVYIQSEAISGGDLSKLTKYARDRWSI